jgi:hypothetical protein
MNDLELPMTCNECGTESPLQLGTPDATDPRCAACGAFQMKAGQVAAYGESLADWLSNLPISSRDLRRIRDMSERFFWLVVRRGVSISATVDNISDCSETELRLLAPMVRALAGAIAGQAKRAERDNL